MQTALPIAGPGREGREQEGFIRAVLDILLSRTGVDFTCYRPQMLERRIANRVAAAGAASVEEYLRLLGHCAVEPFRLLERITIKVSRFYRHAPTFNYLRDVALPALARERAGEPLQIWSAGCGAGEEPYTFAMLLDQLGIPATIEATDIDGLALHTAREATYPVSALAELPPELAGRYLEPVTVRGHTHFRVRRELAGRVRFTLHDVTSAVAPPGQNRFDLVSCRNVLIYVQRPAQTRAMTRLLDAIREEGLLCLGEAEWPLTELADRLSPLPHRTRLFRVGGEAPFAADQELNRARFRARA